MGRWQWNLVLHGINECDFYDNSRMGGGAAKRVWFWVGVRVEFGCARHAQTRRVWGQAETFEILLPLAEIAACDFIIIGSPSECGS